MKQTIVVKNKKHLEKLIKAEIELCGNECDLNHLDVSQVTDMSYMFNKSSFNGDISKWDLSNVTDMELMFFDSIFNGDISEWDISKVENMIGMFEMSKFNNDLSNWRPYKLKNKNMMFDECPAPKPYWYLAEDTAKAIEIYKLKNSLDNNLDNKTLNPLKTKI